MSPSFNVLKDASSAAIYGTRGSNGVIIVETKSCGTGTRTYRLSTSCYYAERAARKLDMMSANQYLDYLTRHGNRRRTTITGSRPTGRTSCYATTSAITRASPFRRAAKFPPLRLGRLSQFRRNECSRTGNEQLMGRINFRQDFFNRC
ncbi:MAG: hypothetical protein ACLSGF_10375 [Alistipes onderdonkii]